MFGAPADPLVVLRELLGVSRWAGTSSLTPHDQAARAAVKPEASWSRHLPLILFHASEEQNQREVADMLNGNKNRIPNGRGRSDLDRSRSGLGVAEMMMLDSKTVDQLTHQFLDEKDDLEGFYGALSEAGVIANINTTGNISGFRVA